MGRTCHLHIGMMKTGSTSIQAAFHHYDDGRTVYLAHERRNHSALLRRVAQSNPRPPLADVGNELTDTELEQRIDDDRRLFEAALARRDRDFVISAEELTSTFNAKQVAVLASLLHSSFDVVHVIGYVRDPASFMASILPQRIKLRQHTFDIEALYPNYERLFAKWIDAVGTEQCELVRFDRATLSDGDVVSDFTHRVGADPDLVKVPQHGLNRSLTAEAFAVLYRYRQERGGPRDDPQLARANPRVLRALQSFGSCRVGLDSASVEAVLERQRDDIAWIERLIGEELDSASPAPSDDAITFATEDEILAVALEMAPQFLDFVAAQGCPVRRDDSIVDAMDALYGFREND